MDQNGSVVTDLQYDASGNLASSTATNKDSVGAPVSSDAWTYTYATDGNLASSTEIQRNGNGDLTYQSGTTFNLDGSSVTQTYTAATGVYGYDVVNADQSSIDYQTTYDGNGGYHQTWTASTGQSGVNDKSDDGSTLTSTTNADGSSVTQTYTAATGVYGYDVVNADQSSIDYQTTYDGNGGYHQTWTASTGQSGVNDKSDDGSSFTSTTKADGTMVQDSYDTNGRLTEADAYDSQSNLTSKYVSPDPSWDESYTYDAQGKTTSDIYDSYDTDGNILETRTTTFAYDSKGELILHNETDAFSQFYSGGGYGYGFAPGEVYTFNEAYTYDDLGRETSDSDSSSDTIPNLGTTTREDSNVYTYEDTSNQWTSYSYSGSGTGRDGRDWELRETYNGSGQETSEFRSTTTPGEGTATEESNYSYDANGTRIAANGSSSNPSGSIVWNETYNGAGQEVSYFEGDTTPDGKTSTIQWSYTYEDGALTSYTGLTTNPDGSWVSDTYDGNGNLISESSGSPGDGSGGSGDYAGSNLLMSAVTTTVADSGSSSSGTNTNKVLDGFQGNETLVADGGNDIMIGGGNDAYVFGTGDGRDTIVKPGFDASPQDKILFTDDVLKDTVALFQRGQDLIIGYGTSDTIDVTSEFQPGHAVGTIQLNNGQLLTPTDINHVIQEINAFTSSHGIQLTGVNDVKNNQELMTIVGNAWHS